MRDLSTVRSVTRGTIGQSLKRIIRIHYSCIFPSRNVSLLRMKRWTLSKVAEVAGASEKALVNWYTRGHLPRPAARLTVADALLAGIFSELAAFSPLPVARERALALMPELGRTLAAALRGEPPELAMVAVGELAGAPSRLALCTDVAALNATMGEILAARGRLHVVPVVALIVRAGLAQVEFERATGTPLALPLEAAC